MSSLFIFSVSIHIQLARFAGVLIPVECEEEEPVETAVEHDHEVHPHRVATGGVYQRDQAVDKDDQELDHLHGGQIFLPPEVLLEPGARRGQEVVGVHDDVDQGVPHPAEGCVAAPSELGTEPACQREGAVVEDVEQGQVGHLTAEQEKYRVEKIDEL